VINDNKPAAGRTTTNPAFAGTRVRVFKKSAVYNGATSLVAEAR